MWRNFRSIEPLALVGHLFIFWLIVSPSDAAPALLSASAKEEKLRISPRNILLKKLQHITSELDLSQYFGPTLRLEDVLKSHLYSRQINTVVITSVYFARVG